MNGELKTEGKYELFTTTGGKEVLNLDNQAYYSFPKGQQGDVIESTDPDPDKESSLAGGKYFFVQKENEGSLFLQDGSEYRQLVLPHGLPTKRDEPQKKVSHKKEKLSENQVKGQITN